jgi:phytoene synthase
MSAETAAPTRLRQASVRQLVVYAAMRIPLRAQREAMFRSYSFCRQVDDIADSMAPRDERLAALQHGGA